MPLTPIISIVTCLYLMLQLPRITWIRFGVWLLLGLVIYFTYGMRNSRLAKKAERRQAGAPRWPPASTRPASRIAPGDGVDLGLHRREAGSSRKLVRTLRRSGPSAESSPPVTRDADRRLERP